MLRMELGERSYDILIQRGCLQQAGQQLNLNRKVCIVTDEGVPRQYVASLAAQCKEPVIVTVDVGEETKTMETVTKLCRVMLERGFSRKDCVAAVGGGMVGDLAGFAAACFMRGVDFYNIPTTLLSQVDSSIGGKTGVNLDGVKNIVGAFWQPRKVLIDPDTLDTLSPRLYAEGMAEAVKMALASDEKLFAQLEQGDLPLQVVHAGVLLGVEGIPVLGRAAFDYVGDIDVFSAVQVDEEEHLIQQLARPAHEGLALEVLVLTGALAHEEDFGIGGAYAENYIVAAVGQGAAAAGQTFRPQAFPCIHSLKLLLYLVSYVVRWGFGQASGRNLFRAAPIRLAITHFRISPGRKGRDTLRNAAHRWKPL